MLGHISLIGFDTRPFHPINKPPEQRAIGQRFDNFLGDDIG
jgi:hypothetical protein